MKALLRSLLWLPLVTSFMACAGDETTGGFVEFTATFPFTPDERSYSQTLDVLEQDEIAVIASEIVCGGLDLSQSRLSVGGIEGADGVEFTLSGTLLDPENGEELDYLEWQGTFSASARQVSFGSESVTLADAGVERIRQILGQRPDKSFEVRFQLNADPLPSLVEVTVVQHVRVATEAGTCP